MIVQDILTEAIELTGLCAVGPKSVLLFKKITRAVQCLANMGNWDASHLYLDLSVQPGAIAILPREVLSPIKININRNPAFSRNRLYEFSLSGPGTQDAGLTGWQWMDQNSVPLLATLPSVGTVLQVQGDPADNTKTITFFGLDNQQNEISDTIVLNGAVQSTTNSYVVMRRVRKDVMTKRLPVSDVNGNLFANYYPDEVEPRYRKIKLSKKATSIHMLFRRTTIAVTSAADYIALDSEQAVLYMLRANEIAANNQAGPSAEVKTFQDLALKYLTDEQAARNSFAAISQADEIQPGWNLNINNRDSLIAADVVDDVFEVFGPIGRDKAFDKITDAAEALNNKCPNWEGSEGYVDLNIGSGGKITLPRYVHRPVKINLGGRHPLQMRNRWFEFHLDGPRSHHTSCDFWDDLGETVVVNEPDKPFRLVALNDIDADDGATVTVYGYDSNGKWIVTPNPDLDSDIKYIDGVILTARYANTLPDDQTPEFTRITRIIRDATNGHQQLLAYTSQQDQPILIGYYYPDETEPHYSQIRLRENDDTAQWVRMRYRKRELKVSSLSDPLHLKSRLAVVNMLRALKAQKDDATKAEPFELKAVQYLRDELSANNPSQQFGIEVDPSVDFAWQGQGQF